MMRVASRQLLAIALWVFASTATATAEMAPTHSGKELFAQPLILRGVLGEERVQMNLHVNAEFGDGVEGHYFVFGQSRNILLAGEAEGDELFLEESENGTDVSGQWSGKIAGDTIAGEWQSADGSLTKPFQMNVVRTIKKAKIGSQPRQ